MKLSKLFLSAIALIVFNISQAQVNPTTGRIKPPDWGVAGVSNATYYYIPAIETYYDIRKGQYVYFQNGKWKRSTTMPITYRDYDLYNGYKVVLTDANEPFSDYNSLRAKYPITYHGELQATIRPKK